MRPLTAVIAVCLVSGRLSAQDTIRPSAPDTRLIRPTTLVIIPDSLRLAGIPLGPAATARRKALDAWAVAHLMPCAPIALADTTGWSAVSASLTADGTMPLWRAGSTVSLPPTFRRDSSFMGAHGGARWVRGTAEFYVEFGHTGVVNHLADRLTSCRFETRGGPYVVDQYGPGNRWFYATPLGLASPHLFVHGTATTVEDLRVLWTAFALSSVYSRQIGGNPR